MHLGMQEEHSGTFSCAENNNIYFHPYSFLKM
jgi:hypothetical protein